MSGEDYGRVGSTSLLAPDIMRGLDGISLTRFTGLTYEDWPGRQDRGYVLRSYWVDCAWWPGRSHD